MTIVAVYSTTADGGAMSVNVPSVQVGDVLIVGVFEGYGATTLAPGGTGAGTWSQIGAQVGNPDPNPVQENVSFAAWRKACTGTGTYTVTQTTTNEGALEVYHLRAVTTVDGTPSIAAVGQGSATATVTMAGVSPTTTTATLIGFYGLIQFSGAATWTPPSGMTERHDLGSPNNFLRIGSASQELVASGATGSRAAVSTVAGSVFGQAYGLIAISNGSPVTLLNDQPAAVTVANPGAEAVVALTSAVTHTDVEPAQAQVSDPAAASLDGILGDSGPAQIQVGPAGGESVQVVLGDAPPGQILVRGPGGESVLIPEPGLPSGGAPHVALWLVDRTTGALSPLPHTLKAALSPVRNSPGAFQFEYPAVGMGFETLRSGIEDQRRRVQVEMWVGGSRFNAMRGYIVQASGDDVAEDSVWQFSGHFLEWRMTDAVVERDPSDERGEVRFAAQTAGAIMRTLVLQAQARGTLTGLDISDFTTGTDSAGQVWERNVGIKFTPYKTTYLTVLNRLVALGLCEWEITVDHRLRIYNPGARGRDLTTYSPPVLLRRAVSLMDSQRRIDLRDVGTDLYGTGAENLYAATFDASARARIGAQIERDVDSNNLEQQGALDAFVQASLPTVTEPVIELTHGLVLGSDRPTPAVGFRVGDWLYSDVGRGIERVRVVQWVLSQDVNGVTGSVTLNDTIGDRMSRLQRQLDAMSDGSATVGTTSATSPGEDVVAPSAPTGLTGDSIAYQDNIDSATYASITVGWAPVTTNTAGPATARAQAAALILARMQSGSPFFEDWTWVGCPPVVNDQNDALLELFELSGAVDAQVWLAGYVAANSQTATVAEDVAGYRVRYAGLGLDQVGPVYVDDPGPALAHREVTPANGVAGTSFVFGGVGVGIPIQVQVRAFDRSGNHSDWSTPLQFTTAVDNVAPPVLSIPGLSTWFRTLDIYWNGLGSFGEVMPSDFLNAEVWISRTAAFTVPTGAVTEPVAFNPAAAGAQHVANLFTAGTWNQPDIPIGVGWYARLVAVDRADNRSAASATAGPVTADQLVSQDLIDDIIDANKLGPNSVENQHVINGAITTAKIVDANIVRAKIADLAVNSAKIEELNAGLITTGTLIATVTLSGIIQTAASGLRWIGDPAGIRFYNSSDQLTIRLEGASGNSLLTGTSQTALSGARFVQLPDGTMRIYPPSGSNYSEIKNFGGEVVWRGLLDGSNRSGRLNVGQTGVGLNFSAESEIPNDLRSEMIVQDRIARITAPVIIARCDGKLSPPSGNRRFTLVTTNGSGVDIGNSLIEYTARSSDSRGALTGTSSGLVWDGGGISVTTASSTTFGPIAASAFTVSSTEEQKTDIGDARGAIDMLAAIRASRSRSYRYVWDAPDAPLRFGPLAGDLPGDLQVPMNLADGTPSVGVDLARQVGVLWGAFGQLEDQRTETTSARVPLPSTMAANTDVDVTVPWQGGPTQTVPAHASVVPMGPSQLQLRALTIRVVARTVSSVTVRFRASRPILGLDAEDHVVVTALYLYRPPFVAA